MIGVTSLSLLGIGHQGQTQEDNIESLLQRSKARQQEEVTTTSQETNNETMPQNQQYEEPQAILQRRSKLKVSIPSFTTSTFIEGWDDTVASQLAIAFSKELSSSGNIEIIERSEDKFVSEEEMAKLGIKIENPSSVVEQSNKAQYIVLGRVKAYEEDKITTRDRGVRLLFLRIGRGKGKSVVSISLEIRIVDPITGEIINAHTLKGTATETATTTGGSINLGFVGFGGKMDDAAIVEVDAPVEQAIQSALIAATDYVECILVKKNSCREEYENEE